MQHIVNWSKKLTTAKIGQVFKMKYDTNVWRTLRFFVMLFYLDIPESKVYWAKMGPIGGRQDPGGPHVGPTNLAIWDAMRQKVD